MEISEHSEKYEEEDHVTQSQLQFSELFAGDTSFFEEFFTLPIRTDETLHLKENSNQKHHAKLYRRATINNLNQSSSYPLIQLQVKHDFTIWMIKILIFANLKGESGFDPPYLSLYLSTNTKDELHVS